MYQRRKASKVFQYFIQEENELLDDFETLDLRENFITVAEMSLGTVFVCFRRITDKTICATSWI